MDFDPDDAGVYVNVWADVLPVVKVSDVGVNVPPPVVDGVNVSFVADAGVTVKFVDATPTAPDVGPVIVNPTAVAV